MMCRPYGVRINTVGCPPASWVGNQRSASSTVPSGILAARSRSTETSVVRGGGSLTIDAAIRLHTVMTTPLCSPSTASGCPMSYSAAWSSPKTIES